MLEEYFMAAEDRVDIDWIEQAGEDSHYNELFYSCGYHVSLAKNLILVFCLCSVVLCIWLLVAVKDLLGYGCCKSSRRHEAWWINALMRILYEVFFEITICLLISFSTIGYGPHDKEQSGMWKLTVALTVLAIVFLCSLTLCCFRGGPYARNSFATSAWTTCWGLRKIKPQLLEEAIKLAALEDEK